MFKNKKLMIYILHHISKTAIVLFTPRCWLDVVARSGDQSSSAAKTSSVFGFTKCTHTRRTLLAQTFRHQIVGDPSLHVQPRCGAAVDNWSHREGSAMGSWTIDPHQGNLSLRCLAYKFGLKRGSPL
jgi:hypothetical protein